MREADGKMMRIIVIIHIFTNLLQRINILNEKQKKVFCKVLVNWLS